MRREGDQPGCAWPSDQALPSLSPGCSTVALREGRDSTRDTCRTLWQRFAHRSTDIEGPFLGIGFVQDHISSVLVKQALKSCWNGGCAAYRAFGGWRVRYSYEMRFDWYNQFRFRVKTSHRV